LFSFGFLGLYRVRRIRLRLYPVFFSFLAEGVLLKIYFLNDPKEQRSNRFRLYS